VCFGWGGFQTVFSKKQKKKKQKTAGTAGGGGGEKLNLVSRNWASKNPRRGKLGGPGGGETFFSPKLREGGGGGGPGPLFLGPKTPPGGPHPRGAVFFGPQNFFHQ